MNKKGIAHLRRAELEMDLVINNLDNLIGDYESEKTIEIKKKIKEFRRNITDFEHAQPSQT